jgi:probable rRNA maturation factor
MKINLFNENNLLEKIDYNKIIEDIETLFNQEFDCEKEVSVIFVNSEEIHEMNKQYRDIDRPTDVLSFEEYEDDYLGEIFICEEKVYEQAISYDHSNEREFAFLLTHGLLHLLGYDHIEKDDEVIMFQKQDELLNKTIYRRK